MNSPKLYKCWFLSFAVGLDPFWREEEASDIEEAKKKFEEFALRDNVRYYWKPEYNTITLA